MPPNKTEFLNHRGTHHREYARYVYQSTDPEERRETEENYLRNRPEDALRWPGLEQYMQDLGWWRDTMDAAIPYSCDRIEQELRNFEEPPVPRDYSRGYGDRGGAHTGNNGYAPGRANGDNDYGPSSTNRSYSTAGLGDTGRDGHRRPDTGRHDHRHEDTGRHGHGRGASPPHHAGTSRSRHTATQPSPHDAGPRRGHGSRRHRSDSDDDSDYNNDEEAERRVMAAQTRGLERRGHDPRR